VLRSVARVAVVVAAVALSACPSFEKPSLSVEGAKVASVDFDGAVVDLTVELENPNKVPLLADRLTFDGFIEGKPLVHSTLKQRVTVPAEGKASVKVPLRFVYKELKGALASLEDKKRWRYEVKGEIGFEPHEKLAIALPFTKDGELPAPQLPTVKAGEPRLENVSLQGLTVVVDVTVTNPNAFALPAGSLKGTLKVGGVDTPLSLSVPGTPSEKSQKVTLRQQVSLLKAASVGVDLMAGRSVKAELDTVLAFGERQRPLKAALTLKR